MIAQEATGAVVPLFLLGWGHSSRNSLFTSSSVLVWHLSLGVNNVLQGAFHLGKTQRGLGMLNVLGKRNNSAGLYKETQDQGSSPFLTLFFPFEKKAHGKQGFVIQC